MIFNSLISSNTNISLQTFQIFSAILLDPTATLSDHLLHAVLSLLHREISDHGRHLPHYFSLFYTYASLGLAEKAQLLKVKSLFHFS